MLDYKLKCVDAYNKYINNRTAKTILDSKHSTQRIYIETTIFKNKKHIGFIAKNVNTHELFFISQEDLNNNISEGDYIEQPYFGDNIKLIREVIRCEGTVVFPYTTMIVEIDEVEK